MKFISHKEAAAWLLERGIYSTWGVPGVESFVEIPLMTYGSVVLAPESFNACFHLADVLVTMFGAQEVILWIALWNTASNDAEFAAFNSVRSLSGAAREIRDQPACLVNLNNPVERGALVVMTGMMMAFCWEGWIVSYDACNSVWLSNDCIQWDTMSEVVDVSFRNAAYPYELVEQVPKRHRDKGSRR